MYISPDLGKQSRPFPCPRVMSGACFHQIDQSLQQFSALVSHKQLPCACSNTSCVYTSPDLGKQSRPFPCPLVTSGALFHQNDHKLFHLHSFQTSFEYTDALQADLVLFYCNCRVVSDWLKIKRASPFPHRTFLFRSVASTQR